jgi:hypothetical protein
MSIDRYASLKQGLVGCWIPSVSGSGLLLPDLARNNHGVLTNMDASDWVSGQYGRALDFDGVNDYVQTSSAFRLTNGFTLSLWMLSSNVNQTNTYLLSVLDSSSTDNAYSIIYGFVSQQIELYTGTVALRTNSQISISNTEPNHIVYAYDGQKLLAYLNGRQVNSNTVTATLNAASGATYLSNFGPGFSRFYNGRLDDIRIYNRALTEPEIKLLASEPGIGYKPAKKLSRFSQRYTYEPPPATQYGVIRQTNRDHVNLREGLVGAWCPSVAGSGLTLPDLSGRNNHGTLTNMGPEDWVSAQYGRALDFDGVNDYVEVNDSFRFASTGSVVFWYRGSVESGTAIYFGDRANSSFTIYLGNNVTNTLSNELITVVHDVGGLARIYGYTTATRGELYDNNWHHVAVVQRVANTNAEIWIDGVSKTVTNGSSGLSTYVIGNTSFNFLQFASERYSNTNNFFLTGQMDDIRFTTRPFSPAEIKLLASRPGIGLVPERRRTIQFQQQQFSPAWSRRQQLIGSGVY